MTPPPACPPWAGAINAKRLEGAKQVVRVILPPLFVRPAGKVGLPKADFFGAASRCVSLRISPQIAVPKARREVAG
jgi:hypothetical protein